MIEGPNYLKAPENFVLITKEENVIHVKNVSLNSCYNVPMRYRVPQMKGASRFEVSRAEANDINGLGKVA
jgi:hypothetical protein